MRADGRGLELGVFRLKGPRNESGELSVCYRRLAGRICGGRRRLACSTGYILLHADAVEVFDTFFDGLYMAEHHGGGGGEVLAMGDGHDFQPVIAHGLERRNFLAHAIDEDFATSAGDGAEASRRKVAHQVFQRFIKDITEMHKLTWAEAMHVDGREFFPNVREQIEVPLFAERGVMSTLHEDLRAAKREGFQGQGIKLQRVRRRNAVAIPSLLQQLIHGGSVIRSEGRGNDSP